MAETGSWLNREFKSGFQSRTWFKKKYWYIFLMNRGVDQIKRPPGWRVYNHTNSIELVGRVFAKVYASSHDAPYPLKSVALCKSFKRIPKPSLVSYNCPFDLSQSFRLLYVRVMRLRNHRDCGTCTLHVDLLLFKQFRQRLVYFDLRLDLLRKNHGPTPSLFWGAETQ